MEEEIWKPVKGFEGVYEVSSWGRIKSFLKHKEGYILSLKNKNKDHYIFIKLISTNSKKTFLVHRLVAQHFIPNVESKPEANHKDRNRQNNRVLNLEWVTTKENNAHARILHPNKIGEWNRKNRSKPVIQLSLSGEYIDEFFNSCDAGAKTGIHPVLIRRVANRCKYKSGTVISQVRGFKWVYKDEYDAAKSNRVIK